MSYTLSMMRTRRKRCDRNHLIYAVYSRSLPESLYIGVTQVENRSPEKSIKRRWQKHVCRAKTEKHNWKLYAAIRRFGPEDFSIEVLEVVRGKAAAHKLEREMIHEYEPDLNTDTRLRLARRKGQ